MAQLQWVLESVRKLRAVLCRSPALDRPLQLAAGMRRPRRLGHHQKPSPQNPSELSGRLFAKGAICNGCWLVATFDRTERPHWLGSCDTTFILMSHDALWKLRPQSRCLIVVAAVAALTGVGLVFGFCSTQLTHDTPYPAKQSLQHLDWLIPKPHLTTRSVVSLRQAVRNEPERCPTTSGILSGLNWNRSPN